MNMQKLEVGVKENKKLLTEKNILKVVRLFFNGHKYQLSNSYIFDWECDYFGVTTSNYYYEVEVKISRGDFKADEKKVNKHNELKTRFNKKKYFTKKGSTYYMVDAPLGDVKRDNDGRIIRKNGKCVYIPNGKFRTRKDCYPGGIRPEYKNLKTELLYSTVYFKEIKAPNRFYYCVPEGMITKDEVPSYAGLLYTDGYRVWQVKTAPFIHKDKIDLIKILLDKFYFLSLNQRFEIYSLKQQVKYGRK